MRRIKEMYDYKFVSEKEYAEREKRMDKILKKHKIIEKEQKRC